MKIDVRYSGDLDIIFSGDMDSGEWGVSLALVLSAVLAVLFY